MNALVWTAFQSELHELEKTAAIMRLEDLEAEYPDVGPRPYSAEWLEDRLKDALGQNGPEAQQAYESEMYKEATKKLSRSQKRHRLLKKHRKPLAPEERAEVMARDATWHHGPNGKETPAVWKSVLPSGEVVYGCNTHRSGATKPSLKGAISAYHNGVKQSA